MKKGCFILLAILILLVPQAMAAVTVTLGSQTVTDDSVSLSCMGETTTGTISWIKLYHNGNPAGTWHINQTEDKSGEGAASTSSTFTVNNLPTGTHKWNCEASDGTISKLAGANGTFTITYSPLADGLPFTGTIANISWAEDTPNPSAIDLSDHFVGTGLEYSVTGNSSISITIASSGLVSLIGSANWSGTETVYFTATEGSITNRSNWVLLNITPVNDEPYQTENIPEQNWTKNTNKTLDLGDYFSDVEGETLNYSVTTVGNIDITISGDEATFSPEADWTGTRTVVFSAIDSDNTVESNSVTLRVMASSTGNSEPKIDSFSPSNQSVSMRSDQARVFSIIASDPDADLLTYSWKLDGEAISGAILNTYTLSKPKIGEHTIEVTVSDTELTTTKNWIITSKEPVTLAPPPTPTKTEEKNDTKPVIIEDEPEAICGDGKADPGENCAGCPQDIKCQTGEVCQNKVCIKKPSNTTALIVFLVVVVVIIGLGTVIYKFSSSKPMRSTKTNIRKGTGHSLSEQPAAEVRDFYKRGDVLATKGGDAKKLDMKKVTNWPKKKKEEEKAAIKEEAKPEKKKNPPPKDETPLQAYVRKMKDKGFDEKLIKKRLKSKGWTDSQIKAALE